MGDYGNAMGGMGRLALTGGTLAFTGAVVDVRLVLLLGVVLTVAGAFLFRVTWRRHDELTR